MSILKLFKLTVSEPIIKKQTVSEIIEEIHYSFYNEVDSLLEQSKIIKSTETQLQSLIDKAKQLKELGFSNTKECQLASVEISRLEDIEAENKTKSSLIEAINYFSQKYPQYKFITEESVVKICDKYGLVYGNSDRYVGSIPTKNIQDIQNFKIKEEDELYIKTTTYRNDWGINSTKINYISKDVYDSSKSNSIKYESYFKHSYSKASLEIAAPKSDFNMEDYEIKKSKISKIEIPDPVVLCPVLYKTVKYYLVVTAWGLEGSDELIVNQKMN